MNNRDGTFREEGLLRGVALSGEGQEMAGMGIGVGDYDLDGHIDLLKTHFLHQSSGLYRNVGKGEFEDVTVEAGLGGEQRFITWGAGIVDLDNDGYPDIFEVTGTVYPELQSHYPAKYPSRSPRLVFRNLGNGRFSELGDESGPGISTPHLSRGCAFGDFDNDGDLDILIMNQNEPTLSAAQRCALGKQLAQGASGRDQEQPERNWSPRHRSLWIPAAGTNRP